MKRQLLIVAYYRLSRPKKGRTKDQTLQDAYGITEQKRAVHAYAEKVGARIIAEFEEIETGTRKKEKRPELEKAIRFAKGRRATLVIGKQDRLARNYGLIYRLMECNVNFIPVDRPDQTRLESQLRAMIDEEEANRISTRTKEGLAAARREGVLLGSARPDHWKGREHLRGFRQAAAASAKVRRERALDLYGLAIDVIREKRAEGLNATQIAAVLNEREILTSRLMPFNGLAVTRVEAMFAEAGL